MVAIIIRGKILLGHEAIKKYTQYYKCFYKKQAQVQYLHSEDLNHVSCFSPKN